MTHEVAPWERQRGEAARQFEAFVAYRTLPPHQRSITAVVKQVIGKTQTIYQWAKDRDWEGRAAEWDDECDRVRRLTLLSDIKDMSERHAKVAVMMQNKLVTRMIQLSDKDISRMSMKELRCWLMDTVKLERMARGEPDTIQEQRQKDDRSLMTPDERRDRIDHLLSIIRAGDDGEAIQ